MATLLANIGKTLLLFVGEQLQIKMAAP